VTMARFWHWCTQPSATSGVRDLIGIALMGMGIIRAIDGLLFVTPELMFAPRWIYALAQIVCGGLLLLTRSQEMRHSVAGRLVASAGCGLCVVLAAASFQVAATSAFVALLYAWLLFLEAGPTREC
jgi:hypothetical protein